MKRGLGPGIALISASVLMLELVLTRVFSVTLYYHFAFLAVSLALFGGGAAGIAVFVAPRWFPRERARAHMTLMALLAAVAVLICPYALAESSLALRGGGTGWERLLVAYTAAAAPFFGCGMCIALAFTHDEESASRLYAWDLAGAAGGCLLTLPALDLLGGTGAMMSLALPLAAAAAWFARDETRGWRIAAGTGVVFGMIAAGLCTFAEPVALITAKSETERPVIFQRWNSFSRIRVKGDPAVDTHLEITIDSDAATLIWKFQGDLTPLSHRRNEITNLAYHLRDGSRPETLIIGPGGGADVLAALLFGARRVTGVEINPIIARTIMGDRFREFSGGLYQRPDVRIVVDEGRSYIRSSAERFDIIQATLVDTWAATSAGAFVLTENNLYTVEAFREYAEHLTEDGMLTLTRWRMNPPQQDLRLISLTRAMMTELGISEPDRHLAMIEDKPGSAWTMVTLIFKRSAFTASEVARLKEVCDAGGFRPLHLPGESRDNLFSRLILTPDPQAFYDAYAMNVAPTRDNSPFFFNNLRPGDYAAALTLSAESQKTNLGTYVLVVLLMITFGVVATFLLGPLLLFRREALRGGRSRLALLAYFAALGLGFITVEIALAQKFTLFLGHPVYALTVVLCSLLLFSSAGSRWTAGRDDARLHTASTRAILALVAVAGAYLVILPWLFYRFVGLPLPLRIALSVALLAPLAFLMGIPMPAGIRLARRESAPLVPWGWGLNGATSVLGSVLTFLIAMSFGFNQAVLFGLAVYAAAAGLLRIAPRPVSAESATLAAACPRPNAE